MTSSDPQNHGFTRLLSKRLRSEAESNTHLPVYVQDNLKGKEKAQSEGARTSGTVTPVAAGWKAGDLELPPEHWRVPEGALFRLLFTNLCLISFGQPHLDDVWEDCQAEESFERCKGHIVGRITSATVVAALLLITTVLFATSVPPVTFVINYNLRGAYLLILLSFGITIGGVAVGSADIYVLRGAKRRAFLTSFMTTRFNTLCCLIVFGYPFLAATAASTFTGAGMLAAIFSANDALGKVGAVIILCIPVCMIVPLFAWTQRQLALAVHPHQIAAPVPETERDVRRESGVSTVMVSEVKSYGGSSPV